MTTLVKRNKWDFPTLVSDLFESDDLTRFYPPSLPSVNIIENDRDFKIELAAPGLERKDFKVEVENGCLTINVEKKREEKEEKANYCRQEFSYENFSRSFDLPENCVSDKIEAHYEGGILKLTLPKKEVTILKPKKAIKVS